FKISKGNSATFELKTVVNNGGLGDRDVKLQLTGIDYNTRALTAGLVQFTSGLDEDFRTDSVLLLNTDVAN
ncbi:MAG: hypothetical protein RLY57_387, partial [Candidatus Parcubacteria bacterium]